MELAKNVALFRQTRALEAEIDEFLNTVSECALIFESAIESYMKEGASNAFEEGLSRVNKMESTADGLRRSVETQLYAQTLIPESRGDVLGLLENLDSVVNQMEGTLWRFSIEFPDIPTEFHADHIELTGKVVLAVESLVLASRAFFRNIEAVGDHMHKVMFYEKEADIVSTKLKRAIFGSDLSLERKIHLRSFVDRIDSVADGAEDVADRLSIYSIKRTV